MFADAVELPIYVELLIYSTWGHENDPSTRVSINAQNGSVYGGNKCPKRPNVQ